MSSEAPPPIGVPVLIDEQGQAWLPHPNEPGELLGCYVHQGFRMAWIPVTELGGLLLTFFGGHRPEPGFEEESVTIALTSDGLKMLVRDLQAISAALEVHS